MINTQRLFSNVVVSLIQTIISGLVLFILYRFLLVQLGTKQLGLWSVILASTSVARLSDLGLAGSVVKFVASYHALNDDIQAANIVQTAVISIACVMGVICIAIYPILDNLLALAIPLDNMPLAITILPWAVLSLWLGSISGVFQSGLDGCQRMDIRNILMISGNLIFLSSAFWLVPNYGLKGLAIGQTVQGLLIMFASWVLLRLQLKSLPLLPNKWSKSKFKEMFSYSVNFQINSIAVLLFDPVIKLLMSRYGGLSSAAFYEMASQLIIKLSALIVSANQALVPAVAELYETAPDQVRNVYLKAYRLMFFVSIPFYASIYISLPLVSQLWIGHIEKQFLLFGAILSFSWCFNTLNTPAYYINLGTGDLTWNSITHSLIAIINVCLGMYLGPILGALGVVITVMISLVTASCFLIYILNIKYKISSRHMIPKESHKLLLAVLICICLSVWSNSIDIPSKDLILINIVQIIFFISVVGTTIWLHPYKKWTSPISDDI